MSGWLGVQVSRKEIRKEIRKLLVQKAILESGAASLLPATQDLI
jgi:hypothetical protein